MSTTDDSRKTVNEYKARIFSYQVGADPLVLQAKDPEVLASLIDDPNRRPLTTTGAAEVVYSRARCASG
jgi:hypothetical protein